MLSTKETPASILQHKTRLRSPERQHGPRERVENRKEKLEFPVLLRWNSPAILSLLRVFAQLASLFFPGGKKTRWNFTGIQNVSEDQELHQAQPAAPQVPSDRGRDSLLDSFLDSFWQATHPQQTQSSLRVLPKKPEHKSNQSRSTALVTWAPSQGNTGTAPACSCDIPKEQQDLRFPTSGQTPANPHLATGSAPPVFGKK